MAPREAETKEMVEWLDELRRFATGEKEWNTGEIWVCESHRCQPFDMGLSFDCPCGGPGMPPFTPTEG